MENFFKDKYPPGMPSEVDVKQYSSIVDMLEKSCKKFANRPAFTAVGVTITYAELDKLSRDFASFLQNETNLKPGDRIAIQMPNLVQYPVVVFGAMRAGLVVVNTNPLYTRSEEHTSELQSRPHLVCRLLLEKKKKNISSTIVTT